MSTPTPVPLFGQLVPLRTKDEVRASLETTSVYMLEVPAKQANLIKDTVQAAVPDFKPAEIAHLRRVVQFKFLPSFQQKQIYPPSRLPRGEENDPDPAVSLFTSFLWSLMSRLLTVVKSKAVYSEGFSSEEIAKHFDLVRFFILCPTRYIKHADLLSLIRQCPPFDGSIGKAPRPRLFTVTVPSLAPTCAQQAEQWSMQYWPISYKNTNPYGPHPSLVQRNTDEIRDQAGEWLALANAVGEQIAEKCLGESVGVVVVDRTTKVEPEVIVVAGDSRWRSSDGTAKPQVGPGNVMAHAVLRAIAMIAKKRLRIAGTDPTYLDRSLFCDGPLTDIEEEHYIKDNLNSGGYLCVDLDIYLTNEPCVMCSMAILHSRFRRCVFTQRMPLTGGMTSEKATDLEGMKGLQHGLFWRPSELNWKFLTWEFKEDTRENDTTVAVRKTLHV